jgi:hypothetical protein
MAPLACALGPLAHVAAATGTLPGSSSVEEFMNWYVSDGYRVDASALQALAQVGEPALRDRVGTALRATYLPWLDHIARGFQDLLVAEGRRADTGLDIKSGDCVLFVDGLRLDVGETLRTKLAAFGVNAELGVRLATYPTMTSSGKPAVAPLKATLEKGDGLSPTHSGRIVDAGHLRDLLEAEQLQTLGRDEIGEPAGTAWTETGDLDGTGHKLGIKIVDRVEQEVADISSRVRQLLDGGWQRVHVVTDHGWLLMPGQLPKVELPQHLTVTRKSRCARLSTGAGRIDQPSVPWTWDEDVRIAVPRGIAAFEAGCVYEHGGISPQESITPHLVVTAGGAKATAKVEGIKWIGLRCRIDFADAPAGASVDLRTAPGDPASSITDPKPAEGSDEAKLLVVEDSLIGSSAYVVLLSDSGEILAQVLTRVGE